MRKVITIVGLIIFFTGISNAQNSLEIWNDFIFQLKNNKITIDKIKPLDEMGDSFKPTLLSFLDSLRVQASEEDWKRIPEIIHQDNKILYLIPWSTRYNDVTYCISIETTDSNWYFHHLEAIHIRLDKYDDLPLSEFPDLEENRKNWMRQEIYWSFIVINIYKPLIKDHSKQYVFDLLKDGKGYNVSAKTWVPFLPYHKAFILFMCFEQSNLRGNEVSLIKLDDNEAIIDIGTHFFALYRNTGHLKNNISFDDYKDIFETLWNDRTKYSGWNLELEYLSDYEVRFTFSR
jgi:hypothetical protein